MAKITTPTTLREYINAVISESQETVLRKRALDEKEKQDTTSSQVSSDDLFGDDNGNTDKTQEEPTKEPDATETPSATTTDDKEKLASGEITSDDIRDELNSTRSGKSFSRDEQVKAALDQYVESLSKVERTALMAFLKGISQIVTGTVDAETATEPKDPAPDVKMSKGNEKNDDGNKNNVRHIKPNITTKGNTSQPKVGAEDTTAPKQVAPITPQRRS